MDNFNETPIYSNFNRKSKFLGMIDYQSLVIILIYILLIGYFTNNLPFSLEIKIYIFTFLVIPILALILTNSSNESAIDMILIVIKYYILKGIFVDKTNVIKLKNSIYKKRT